VFSADWAAWKSEAGQAFSGGFDGMGKRGPQPKGEYGRQITRTAVFSTRLQPDTRARLVRAAKVNRRSLSQELEHRLRSGFIQEDNVVDFYGSDSNAAIVKLIGAVIQSTCTSWRVKTEGGWVPDPHKDPGEWLRDQKLFDQVLTAINHALMWFRPGGEQGAQFIFFASEIAKLIDEIRAADPSLPIAKRSTRQHAMAMLKDRLGALACRPHPYDDLSGKKSLVQLVAPKPRKRKRK
jgi:hypothetical protein